MTMTSAQLAILKAEVQNDPLHLGYAAQLPSNPGQVANLLNGLTQTAIQPITSSQFKTWTAQGPQSNIEDAAVDPKSPSRPSTATVLRAMAAADGLDLSNADVRKMFDAWVVTGSMLDATGAPTTSVITQAQHDALIAIATQPASRAFVLSLPTVQIADLIAAGIV